MRTARTVTIRGGVSAPGGGVSALGGVCSRGCLLGGCLTRGSGGLLQGGVCSGGSDLAVSDLGGLLPGGVWPRGGVCSRGCLTWGVSAPRGVWPGGVYLVTYPIMHLMLSVCCLHTNWDTSSVHLLIYCCLVMWPARHTGIPTPPLNRMTDRCKIIPCPKLPFAGGNKNLSSEMSVWKEKCACMNIADVERLVCFRLVGNVWRVHISMFPHDLVARCVAIPDRQTMKCLQDM